MTHAIGLARVTGFVEHVFEEGHLHAKRLQSLANATAGTVRAGVLGIHAIGRGLALAKRSSAKHSVKQVDRLLSNEGIDVWKLFEYWVPYVVAERQEIWVALDWTEFDHDGQSTLQANLVSSHGRATPLIWLSAEQSSLEGMRAEVEDALLSRLRETLPATVSKVVILADRGFGNPGRWQASEAFGFDFVFRIRKDTRVADAKGSEKAAEEWVHPGGRIVTLKGASLTQQKIRVVAFIAVKAPKMKEPWLLVTSLGDVPSPQIVKCYGRRFTIEESFRDIKDLRFGMGLSATRISSPTRRDRLLLLSALSIVLLTLLGAAGEAAGIDRHFKVNTSKKRQYSLFRQGCDYYEFLPGMRDDWARALMEKFSEFLSIHPLFSQTLGTI
jgi:hypothetical protein